MSEIREKYFTTGEFARICHVPKHVLFHYDQIDLFKPAIVKDNQYRYYSYHQYDTFTIITILKSIGMSLQEIKIYLETRTPRLLIDLLNEQEKMLDDKIKKLKHAKDFIKSIRSSTSEALDIDIQNIKLVYMEKEILLCSDDITGSSHKDFHSYTDEYIQFYNNHLNTEDKVGTILSIHELREKNYSHFQCLYTRTKKSNSKNTLIKKTGNYIIGYHHGPYINIYEAYQRAIVYADENHITLGDYAYEEYILSDIAVRNEEDFITMICLETKGL